MLGSSKSGTIAMWVEVGTVGYFKDLKIIVVRDDSKLV
jgi:hypothetical protein